MAAQRSTLVVWTMIAVAVGLAVAAGVGDKEPAMTPERFAAATEAVCTKHAPEFARLTQSMKVQPETLDPELLGQRMATFLAGALTIETEIFRDFRALEPPASSGVSRGDWEAGIDRTVAAMTSAVTTFGKLKELPGLADEKSAAGAEFAKATAQLEQADPTALFKQAGVSDAACQAAAQANAG